jgi:hypothetical protein
VAHDAFESILCLSMLSSLIFIDGAGVSLINTFLCCYEGMGVDSSSELPESSYSSSSD